MPFYYISYCMSVIPVLELLDLLRTDPGAAAELYMQIAATDPELYYCSEAGIGAGPARPPRPPPPTPRPPTLSAPSLSLWPPDPGEGPPSPSCALWSTREIPRAEACGQGSARFCKNRGKKLLFGEGRCLVGVLDIC